MTPLAPSPEVAEFDVIQAVPTRALYLHHLEPEHLWPELTKALAGCFGSGRVTYQPAKPPWVKVAPYPGRRHDLTTEAAEAARLAFSLGATHIRLEVLGR